MVTNSGNGAQPPAVLFSAGLDSAVLLADALTGGTAHPIYVRAGLAWEAQEIEAANRLLSAPLYRRAAAMVEIVADVGPEEAAAALAATDGDVKSAVLVAARRLSPAEAAERLRDAGGNLRRALGE